MSLIQNRKAFFEQINKGDRPKRFIVIAVNTSTSVDTGIGRTRQMPSLSSTIAALTDEQVDLMIEQGGSLLRHNPTYQRLLRDLQADAAE